MLTKNRTELDWNGTNWNEGPRTRVDSTLQLTSVSSTSEYSSKSVKFLGLLIFSHKNI